MVGSSTSKDDSIPSLGETHGRDDDATLEEVQARLPDLRADEDEKGTLHILTRTSH
jgi:hypothetical protein